MRKTSTTEALEIVTETNRKIGARPRILNISGAKENVFIVSHIIFDSVDVAAQKTWIRCRVTHGVVFCMFTFDQFALLEERRFHRSVNDVNTRMRCRLAAWGRGGAATVDCRGGNTQNVAEQFDTTHVFHFFVLKRRDCFCFVEIIVDFKIA